MSERVSSGGASEQVPGRRSRAPSSRALDGAKSGLNRQITAGHTAPVCATLAACVTSGQPLIWLPIFANMGFHMKTTIEIADGVRIKIQKYQITSLMPKGTLKGA